MGITRNPDIAMPPAARCPECHAALGPGTPTACPACFAALAPPPAPKRVKAVRDDEDDGIPMATIKDETPDEDVPFELAADPEAKPDKKPVRSRVKASVDNSRSKAKARAKRNGKKRRSDDEPEQSPAQMRKVVGAVAGVVAFIGAFFLVQYLFFSTPRADVGDGRDGGIAAGSSAESVNAAAGAAAATPGGFVVFDTPGEPTGGGGPAPATEGGGEPRKPVEVRPLVAEKAAAPPEPLPGWAVKPDPPAEPPADIPADLAIKGSAARLAAMNGPFAAVTAAVPRRGSKPGDERPEVIEVVDLRTGETAGGFVTKIGTSYFPGTTWISPDGRWMVGEVRDSGGNNLTASDGLLYVFKADRKPDTVTLRLPGPVAWADFVGPDRLAVYSFEPTPVVVVYTVADGKRVKTIPLPAAVAPPPLKPTDLRPGQPPPGKFSLPDEPRFGAVSPGGRYVAVGGNAGPLVVDLAEGKVAAELGVGGPLNLRYGYYGLNFRPDGGELYAVVYSDRPDAPGRPFRLMSWSLATGRAGLDIILPSPTAWGPPIPGPTPTTLILPFHERGAAVLELRTGRFYYAFPHDMTPARWAGSGRLLGYPKYPGNDTPTVGAMKFDPKEYAEKVRGTPAAVAARPPAGPGDRAGLTPTKPEPPAKWAAPPPVADGTKPPAALSVRIDERQTGMYDSTFAARGQDYHHPHFPVLWRPPGGAEVQLWPWTVTTTKTLTDENRPKPPPPPVAAVAAGGQRLALRDPADPHRVDLFDAAGERVGGFVPYDRQTPVDWLGFAGDRLVTAGGGRLTGWEVPAGKAVWEVEGGYAPMVTVPPGGGWAAAVAGDNVDLIDLASGKCLARRTGPPGGEYLALVASPDGKMLAGIRRIPGVTNEDATGTMNPGAARPAVKPEYVADLWDLATGNREAVAFGRGPFKLLHFAGPEHLLVATDAVDLIDRRVKAVVGAYATPAPRLPGEKRQADPRKFAAPTLPDPGNETDKLLFDPKREYLRPTEGPVRVEVDFGTRERSAEAAAKVAGILRQRGFRIGPNGWALRISYEVVGGSVRLQAGVDGPGSNAPDVKFHWRLYAPDGAKVWEGKTTGQFLGPGSKFYTGKSGGTGFNPGVRGVRVEYYDFGGDMKSAVVGEILDRMAVFPEPPFGGVPTTFLRAGDTAKSLPVPRDPPLRLTVVNP